MYNDYFLDYACLRHPRARGPAPARRLEARAASDLALLCANWTTADFHKVANAIGNTMKFHPHGDASIGDALVQIGQRELAVSTARETGATSLTGDRAAAPRYIEARLSTFALEALFNRQDHASGWPVVRRPEPRAGNASRSSFRCSCSKWGRMGIAVGLACKILPHNFIELIDACRAHYLKGQAASSSLPDFPAREEMADLRALQRRPARRIGVRVRARKIRQTGQQDPHRGTGSCPTASPPRR